MTQFKHPPSRIRMWAARLMLALGVLGGVALYAGARLEGFFTARASGQELRKFNQFVQTANTPAMKLLREGRDLVDGEAWADAAAKFQQFLDVYPKDRDADVALYWLAYALKQQGRARESAERLSRLLSEFPKSNWAEEARAMLTELAPQTGDRRVIDESLNVQNEEIRIVALQSLFQANPERAQSYVADLLKPGSSASRGFKEAAVSMLGSHGGRQSLPLLLEVARTQPDAELRMIAARRLADFGGESVVEDLIKLYDAERDPEVKASILRAFEGVGGARARAKVLEVARNPAESTELRQTAVRVLGDREDDDALEDLMRVYEADNNREVRQQIIRTLADMEDPRGFAKLAELARGAAGDPELRKTAVRVLGDREGEAAVEELFRIYESERDAEVKEEALRALGHHESPRAYARVAEIARARGGDRELRKAAIRILADHDRGRGAVELLVGLYDAETDAELKADILRSLANTKEKGALRKLLDVARRDPDIELRKRAISLLGESDDPEAARFLEELLKKQ
jgi:HEAT repeat protein